MRDADTPDPPTVACVLTVDTTTTSAISCSCSSAGSDPGVAPDDVAVLTADEQDFVLKTHSDGDGVGVVLGVLVNVW